MPENPSKPKIMDSTSKNPITLKSGRVFPAGQNFNVLPSEDRPDFVAVCYPASGDSEFRIPYSKLPKYFNDFPPITEQEIEDAIMDFCCPSISGESVEPDGHDSHGFPSWLLALGLC